MPSASFHFPKGFLWGTATAAHQVEGNNTNNNWWAWEQGQGNILQGHKSGLACDWWGGRWKEDFDRAAETGQNAHRLSVEWSRIQPEPDRWDEDALERYRAMLRGLVERGLKPLVTLHHYTDPLWLAELTKGAGGGWEDQHVVIPFFEKFVRKTVEALKEYCDLWCTLNELNANALAGYAGTDLAKYPPGRQNFGLAMRVQANLIRGHAAAFRAIHEIQPEGRAGLAVHYRSMHPWRSRSPLDKWVARLMFTSLNDAIPSALATGVMRTPLGSVRIPEARGAQDYYGFNYYTRSRIRFNLARPKTLFAQDCFPADADLSETGYLANVPEGMFEGLKWVVRRFPKLPIIVTENGVEDSRDTLRPRYLAQHIHQVWRAVNFNWPIRGYFHWSLVDNFEWERGWTQRFGLWGLDTETQKRTRRPSVDLYAAICKENGLTSEMVEQYCPEAYEKLFPG